MYGSQQYGKVQYGSLGTSVYTLLCRGSLAITAGAFAVAIALTTVFSGAITVLGQNPVTVALTAAFAGTLAVTQGFMPVLFSFVLAMVGSLTITATTGWTATYVIIPLVTGVLAIAGHMATVVSLSVVAICAGSLSLVGAFPLKFPLKQRTLTPGTLNKRASGSSVWFLRDPHAL